MNLQQNGANVCVSYLQYFISAGNFIYEKTGTCSKALQFFNHQEGYVKNDNGTFNYVYQYKDHLGNVRLSYTDNNNDGVIIAISGPDTEIIEESNYYPFGLKHKGYNTTYVGGNATAQKFKYNGIELEEVTGLYEMNVRSYDPAVARFTSIDPVTHHSMSTYTAFDNNPVFWADPSGADSETFDDYWNCQVANDENGGIEDSGSKKSNSSENKSIDFDKMFNETPENGASYHNF